MTSEKAVKEKISIKARNKLHRDINEIFKNAGFSPVATEGRNIVIAGERGEFDNIFILENIIILEETTLKDTNDHLRKKVEYFRHCVKYKKETFATLSNTFPRFSKRRGEIWVSRLHFLAFICFYIGYPRDIKTDIRVIQIL